MTRFRHPLQPLSIALLLVLLCPPAHAAPWLPVGPDGGDARAFAVDPADHTHLYLGTVNGWIYQSHDGGSQWTRLARVGRRDDLVIDNIVVDPANPKHLLAGGWKPADLHDGGLFVSDDSGQTWSTQTDMQSQSVRALTQAPSDPKIIVAGTLDGVFRSQDNGAHWQLISTKDDKELHEVESIAIDPINPDIIYAGTWHLPWKTTDGGAHWTSIKQGIAVDSDVFSIIVDPKQPGTVYLSACSGIYKSIDGGGIFLPAKGIPTTAHRTRVLLQDPNHPSTVYGGTTAGLYRTDDAGKTWTLATGPEIIVNDVYIDPTNSRHVLLATDRSGVLASEDGGLKFTASNTGFSARQVIAYTADAQHSATSYIGVVNDKDWGGVFVSHNGGLTWSQQNAGLSGRDVFSLGQGPDGTILAGTGHGIYRLQDAAWQRTVDDVKPKVTARPARGKAASLRNATPPASQRPATAKARATLPATSFDGGVYAFASTGDTVYAATSQGILRSVSSGATWSPLPSIPKDEYRFLATSKLNVVAASLHAAEMSNDGGATWTALTMPEEVTQISALSVDGDANVWLGGREGVFYTSDKGVAWHSLKDLYLRNANSIFFDAQANRVLATSTGPATIAFAVQLPSLQVTTWDTGWDLRFVRPVGDHLVAGTLFDGIVVEPRMVDTGVVATR